MMNLDVALISASASFGINEGASSLIAGSNTMPDCNLS